MMVEETEEILSVEEMIEGDPEGLAGMMIEETEEILGGEEMKIGGTEMEEEEMGEGMTEKWMMLEVDCRVWLKGGRCPFLTCQIYQDQRICPRRKTTEQGAKEKKLKLTLKERELKILRDSFQNLVIMDSHLADLVDSAPQDLKVHLVSVVQEGSGEPKTDHLLVVVLQDLVALGLTVLSEAVEVA